MIVVYGDNKKGLLTEIIPGIAEPRSAAPAEPSEQDEQTEPPHRGRPRKAE